jgi:hypothetical protein
MTCYLSCGLSLAFIVGFLYIFLGTKKKLLEHSFAQTLNKEQKEVYYQIVNERFRYAIQGKILGVLFACIYLYLSYKLDTPPGTMVCMSIVILVITQILFYKIMPKSKWMLNYLDKKEQVDAWLEIYKFMANRGHIGFVIGIIAFILLSWSALSLRNR